MNLRPNVYFFISIEDSNVTLNVEWEVSQQSLHVREGFLGQ